MANLKLALKTLLDKDKIVLPEALDVLQSISDPQNIVKQILKNEPEIQTVDEDIVKKYIELTKADTLKIKKPPRSPTTLINAEQPKFRKLSQIFNTKIEDKFVSNHSKINSANSTTSTVIKTSLDDLHGLHNYEPQFEVIRNPSLSPNLAGEIEDIVGYFQDRFKKLSIMFRKRRDIKNIEKISDLKQNHKKVSVIGMLTDKSIKDESSARILLEDPTSDKRIEGIINNDPVLVEKTLQLMNDSVICLNGSISKGLFFVEEIHLPDLPRNKKIIKTDIPVHVAFLSDIHVGSKNFLNEPMEKFIKFLNGEYGNTKMRRLGEQTKYVLFSGDVVDGVGIYPNQQADLSIDSIHEQYNEFARFLDNIPEDIEIVVIPGNHDMVRSAEPQPSISPKYAPDLSSFDNVHMLPNPAQISLHGIQTLLYHCTSLPDILNHIPGLDINLPVDVMVHMLKARHLAPIWGDKTPIAAEPEDHLIIDPVPDIFHGGHIHINGRGSYRGVQIVNSGTMQSQTSYQKSLNIIPTPGKVPITNLKDRKLSIIDFMSS